MKGDRLQGRRLADRFAERDDFRWSMTQPGDYWLERDGSWHIIAPTGQSGGVESPKWTLTVEPDGSLTVSPSIWINKPKGWHGYLEKGIWREV